MRRFSTATTPARLKPEMVRGPRCARPVVGRAAPMRPRRAVEADKRAVQFQEIERRPATDCRCETNRIDTRARTVNEKNKKNKRKQQRQQNIGIRDATVEVKVGVEVEVEVEAPLFFPAPHMAAAAEKAAAAAAAAAASELDAKIMIDDGFNPFASLESNLESRLSENTSYGGGGRNGGAPARVLNNVLPRSDKVSCSLVEDGSTDVVCRVDDTGDVIMTCVHGSVGLEMEGFVCDVAFEAR